MMARMLGLTLLLLGLMAWPWTAAATTTDASVGCSGNDCVDIWDLVCPDTKSKCFYAQVCDDNTLDDVLVVTVIFYSPTSPLVGLSQVDQADNAGGCATVQVCRHEAGPSRALITVSNTSNTGTEYQITGQCRDKDGNVLADTLTQVTSE